MNLHAAPPVNHHTSYLLNGKLLEWSGARAEVRSPILTGDADDKRGALLGSAPDMDEASALEALESARKAYDFGRGFWPTAEAGVRIAAMEKFIQLIMPRRE